MAAAGSRHRDPRLLATRRVDESQAERVLFALVANRALAPSSKLAATRWIASDVAIDGLDGIHEDACYRAMDALLDRARAKSSDKRLICADAGVERL